jgi:adenine-specific DNA-methyltransferase
MPIAKHDSAKRAIAASLRKGTASLFQGDCSVLLASMGEATIDLTITSPPYCIGKAYESESTTTADFIKTQMEILPEIVRVTKVGGAICWQTGYHVTNGVSYPLDYAIYDILKDFPEMHLRNRIIWSFGHGLHSTARFSGRHEVVLWFSKGDAHNFDLDAIRVPQKYPGKRHYKGEHKGTLSGNPLGKNPGDVWEMPNVNANHIEKTDHPCQFPVALAQRFIRALCPPDGIVFDPFMGSGSSGVAALIEERKFLGAETVPEYMTLCQGRLDDVKKGLIRVRDINKPIYVPSPNSAVARRPEHFLSEDDNGHTKKAAKEKVANCNDGQDIQSDNSGVGLQSPRVRSGLDHPVHN